MDKAALFTDLTRRNALRKANGLPLLDLRTEYAHQVWIGRRDEYWTACDDHADDREDIHRGSRGVSGEYGPNFPSTSGGHWAVGLRTKQTLRRIHGTEIRRISTTTTLTDPVVSPVRVAVAPPLAVSVGWPDYNRPDSIRARGDDGSVGTQQAEAMVAFYDLMFNQCQPGGASSGTSARSTSSITRVWRTGRKAFVAYFERRPREYPGKRVTFQAGDR